MNAHALSVLELPRVLDVVAGFATSNLGGAHIRSLSPSCSALEDKVSVSAPAAEAAFSHDSLLVPISSITSYMWVLPFGMTQAIGAPCRLGA